MKGLVLLAALGFLALQSVVIIDCPCAALCGHKNRCEEAKESPDDCCRESRKGPLHEEACFHLEPQSDVDAPVTDSPAVTPLVLAAVAPRPVVPVEFFVPVPPSESPHARDCPLYLQHSRLLI